MQESNTFIQNETELINFEEDLLFRTSFLESNICEIPIKTIYFDKSNLSPLKTIVPFLYKHLKNFFERFIYDISK